MMFLLLDTYPQTLAESLFTRAKILMKDVLIGNHWDQVSQVFKGRSPVGGSITLIEGLAEELRKQSILFRQNDFSENRRYETCYVARDPRNLKWALEQKHRGFIKKVIAGPLIVSHPAESQGIAISNSIDRLIFASSWFAEMFRSEAHKMGQAKLPPISIWPMGVDPLIWKPEPLGPSKLSLPILIYNKKAPNDLVRQVLGQLESRKISHQTIQAGSLPQRAWRERLLQSRSIIFLSRTETQGLSMFEAWSCNRPTLHWNPGTMLYGSHTFQGASSAPYLTPQCGMSFQSESDLPTRLSQFLKFENHFSPRKWILENGTREKSIQQLLEILTPNASLDSVTTIRTSLHLPTQGPETRADLP